VSTRRIEVATRRPYPVEVGAGALQELASALPRPAAVLTDANVERLHAARLGTAAHLPRLALEPGEDSKSLATLERVLEFLAAAGLDRRATLVAFGGGVVGDLGGLAAALYMRGIETVQCPTTLLAQVDSSVGGKTAVNLRAGKNLAGVFHQPRLVLADSTLLATLSDEELRSGLGEVVKSALLAGAEAFAELEREAERLLAREPEALAAVVARCVALKASVVARDEEERGERKSLNLGHTFAHALERAAGYGRIPHGVAVATGLALALEASRRAGQLAEHGLAERLARLLARLGLAGDLAELRARYGVRLEPAELRAAMRHDKKGGPARPAFVLVRGLGRVAWDQELDERVLAELLA
jgi:3-dehydroquinate synthase